MSELKSMLEKISDVYDGYADGIMRIIQRKPEIEQKTIDFIKENPDANTSQVQEYVSDFLFDGNGVLLPEFRCVD